MRRDSSRGALFNLPKCEWAVKVCAAERKFRILLPDGSTFLQLKTAGTWTPGALGKKSKHGGLDNIHLQSDTKIYRNLFSYFFKKL